MEKSLNYSDVYLIPRHFSGKSRSEIDISIDFLGRRFDAPYLPSNMLSVINVDIAKWLSFNNYFYIYHRFSDTRKFLQKTRAESWPYVSISIGVKDADAELILDIKESKCRVDAVCIDIAHGFTDATARMIGFIKSNLPDTKVIAGNVWGDKDSIQFLQNAGADAIKLGLSMGKGCSTFATTAFGSPMFSAALEAGKWAKVPLIIDGGVRQPGDIARAICAVRQHNTHTPMVMIGSLLAACTDAPGENVSRLEQSPLFEIKDVRQYNLKHYKKYNGSASAENKQKTGQEVKNIEGISVELPCNGKTYAEYYQILKEAVQSSTTYGGGSNLDVFSMVKYGAL